MSPIRYTKVDEEAAGEIGPRLARPAAGRMQVYLRASDVAERCIGSIESPDDMPGLLRAVADEIERDPGTGLPDSPP